MVRGKQFCYEEGLHVPLIIRWPKSVPVPAGFTPGHDDARMIEAIDLTASTLSWAGVKKPAGMQGRVFLGADAEPPRQMVFGARDKMDETLMRHRTVRDERYRYIRNFSPEMPFFSANLYKEKQYPVWNLMQELHKQGKLTPVQEVLCQPRMPEEELYDLTADPDEINNLAASQKREHQMELKKLRAAVTQWIKETKDRGEPKGGKNTPPIPFAKRQVSARHVP